MSVADFAARARIALAPQPGVTVSTAAGMKETAASQLAMYTSAPLAMTVLVVAIGAIAVSGLFALDVATRQRTLGVLRAVGATPRGVRSLVLGEALRYALASCVSGGVGGLISGLALNRLIASALGSSVGVEIPLGLMAGVFLTAVAAVLIAALPASNRAARLSPATILRAD